MKIRSTYLFELPLSQQHRIIMCLYMPWCITKLVDRIPCHFFMLLLLARLTNRQVEMLSGFVGAVRNDSTVSVVGIERQSKGGGCHESNDHSRGNGCALSVRFCSCTDQGFGCDLLSSCASIVLVLLGSVCSPVELGGDRPLSSFDDLLSMTVLTASWWMLLMSDL